MERGVTAEVAVRKVTKLSKRALSELCDAASEAIRDGAGFGWLRPPPAQDFDVMNLSVRETQTAAVHLYEALGFKRWGTHPKYALVDGKTIAGHYYYKEL